MRSLLSLAINAAALWVATRFVGGLTYDGQWPGLLGLALVFGAVNTVLRPVFAFFALPLQFLTLGLFTFVLNAAMLKLTGWLAGKLGIAFQVDGWWPAILGAFVVSVTAGILNAVLRDDEDDD